MKKKKLKGSLPAKIAAICLVIVCLTMSAASAAAVAILDDDGVYGRDEEEILRDYNEQYLHRYSVYAIANYMNENEEQLEELNQTNFRYGIIQADDLDAVDLNDEKSYLAGNIDKKVTKESVNIYSCDWNEDTCYDYDMGLFGYAWVEPVEPVYEFRPVEAYYYNRTNEQLYVKAGGILYPYGTPGSGDVLAICDVMEGTESTFTSADEESTDAWDTVVDDGFASDMSEVQTEAITFPDDGDTQREILNNSFLDESGADWCTPSLVIVLASCNRYLSAEIVRVVDDDELLAQGELVTDWTVESVGNGGVRVPLQTETVRYYVVSYVNDPLAIEGSFRDSDLFVQAKLIADYAYAYRYALIVCMFVSALLAIAAFVFLMCAAGHRNGVEGLCRRPWDAIPLDVNILGAFGIGTVLVYMVIYAGEELNPLKSMTFWLIAVCAGIVAILLVIECCMSFALWWKLGKWWKHTLIYVFEKYCWKGCRAFGRFCLRVWICFVKLVRSIRFLWKAWLILALIAGLELSAACVFYSQQMFVFLCVEKLVLYPALIFGLLQLDRLREGGRRLAAGDLTSKIDTSKMYWEFKRHGDNLNAVGDGMNAAVGERLKSERFKTELITNVSHDIKTPLTSIINYVDLLGKEQLDNPKAEEYLEVLSRQSARLKKLIEDLIEASKASTGNLKVSMEVCDAQVALIQTLGEYEEKLAQGQIELHVREPEDQIQIKADSRHLWRVFDNLMNNICKYAQPGTRAYVNLEQEGSRAVITFRNISREPLNITSEELMERFVRGDSSRSMEGNGLGLSIARSLTELMGGSLELIVDGDLFKVVLSFPVC